MNVKLDDKDQHIKVQSELIELYKQQTVNFENQITNLEQMLHLKDLIISTYEQFVNNLPK